MADFDPFANQGGPAAWDPDNAADSRKQADELLGSLDELDDPGSADLDDELDDFDDELDDDDDLFDDSLPDTERDFDLDEDDPEDDPDDELDDELDTD